MKWGSSWESSHEVVSFEVFKRSPQPLKAGIVATAEFRSFMEFNTYSQRCISASCVAACSACNVFNPAASPCTLAKPKVSTTGRAREGRS